MGRIARTDAGASIRGAGGVVPQGMRVAMLLLAWLVPGVAAAHIQLLEPAARYDRAFIKDGPCGHPDNPPSDVERTTVMAGETLVVRWDEFVAHPGHFRIALSLGGDDELVDPEGFENFYVADNVLLDGIEDPDGKTQHEVEITIPDVSCESCTLQLIQVMTDKPPWGPDGGRDLYYQCADLEIVGGSVEVPGATEASLNDASEGAAAAQDDEGGCSVGARRRGRSAPGWLMPALTLMLVRRRRA